MAKIELIRGKTYIFNNKTFCRDVATEVTAKERDYLLGQVDSFDVPQFKAVVEETPAKETGKGKGKGGLTITTKQSAPPPESEAEPEGDPDSEDGVAV